MKTILIVTMSIFALTASARVGTQFFSHSISGTTEAILLDKVETTIPLITSGKIKSPFQTNCWPNNSRTIKIKNIDIQKSYSIDSYGNLSPYFTGTINYLHKRCREDR